MSRIETLEREVDALYMAKNPDRADWADWLFDNHVHIVGDYAVELANRYNANVEYSRAAALLHDIADAVMKRFDERHENASLELARVMLERAGFQPNEIAIIVDDAIRYHSCHNGEIPQTLEGKVLATADSLAHLKTDFYEFFSTALRSEMSEEALHHSITEKLNRDYNKKIQFDEIKREVEPEYLQLTQQYVS